MEKIMTVEERIRRAEEIYNNRKRKEGLEVKSKDSKNEKKDIKLLKKVFIQLVICMCIYFTIYIIQKKQYIFSEDFINKINEIISYDIEWKTIYEEFKNYINKTFSKEEENKEEIQVIDGNDKNELEQNVESINGMGGAESITTEVVNEKEEQNELISQEEQDIANVKNTTTFVIPVEGIISSTYGYRETATGNVPKNHSGTDIAVETGTKIKSSTDGQVVLASEEGDYGKHIKIQIGEVSIIYAHCNSLYVKEGDIVKQGQEIAEVGSTGNSTGPHLHFEIRISERTVDPQKILEL